MKRDHPIEDQCGALTRKGTPCEHELGWGTGHPGEGRCRLHGGLSPNAEVAGQVALARREAVVMGVPLPIEPHEAILRCIEIVWAEVRYCSERVAELSDEEAAGPVVTRVDRPLKEEKGAESTEYRAEEVHYGDPKLHIWIQARREAMVQTVQFSVAAAKAGIQERLVKLAEGQAQILADAFTELVKRLGHDPADPKSREAMRGALTLVAGGQAA